MTNMTNGLGRTDDENVTGAGRSFVLNGITYVASPLDDVDIVELDEWLRQRYLKNVLAATSSLPEDDRDGARRVAYREAVTLTWMSGHGARMMATAEGMARLVWTMVRKRTPAADELVLRKAMFDPKNVLESNEVFRALNVPESMRRRVEEGDANDTRPRKTRASRHKAAAQKAKKRSRARKSTGN